MPSSVSFRTIIHFSLIALFLLFVVGYVIFQARFLIVGPRITLTELPSDVSNQRQVTLSGSAFNITRLWLNDRPIYTDPDGNFKEAFVLENGYTIATLRAEDRYGRTTTVTESFVYLPASFMSAAH